MIHHNPPYENRYEIRDRYNRFLLHGKSVADYTMPEETHVVIDRFYRVEGDYNRVVARVTSEEAALAALRLLGAETKLERP